MLRTGLHKPRCNQNFAPLMPLIVPFIKPFKRQTLSLYSENGWFFPGKTWQKTKHCSCDSFKRSSANAKIDNATVNYNIGGGTPNGSQIKLFHFIHCSPHNSDRLHGSRAIYTKCVRLNTTVLVMFYEFDHSSYKGMANQQSTWRRHARHRVTPNALLRDKNSSP